MALLRLAASLVDDGGYLGEHTLAALKRPWSRPQRPDDKQLPCTALHVKERKQTGECCPAPHVPPRGWVVVGERKAQCARQRIVETGEKALLAVGEQFVERAPRHPRTLHDMRNRDVTRPALGADLEQRRQQARALDLDNTPVPVRVLATVCLPPVLGDPRMGELSGRVLPPTGYSV